MPRDSGRMRIEDPFILGKYFAAKQPAEDVLREEFKRAGSIIRFEQSGLFDCPDGTKQGASALDATGSATATERGSLSPSPSPSMQRRSIHVEKSKFVQNFITK